MADLLLFLLPVLVFTTTFAAATGWVNTSLSHWGRWRWIALGLLTWLLMLVPITVFRKASPPEVTLSDSAGPLSHPGDVMRALLAALGDPRLRRQSALRSLAFAWAVMMFIAGFVVLYGAGILGKEVVVR
jgi:hypothetical protein